MSNLTKSLIKVQSELKAPKGQRNKFGNYNYRSAEDILEAVKPLLAKNNLAMQVSDSISEVAGIPFVESMVIVSDGTDQLVVTAQAGIDPNRKGMDISQSFGSSSSYARKYCLNGIFLIDDTRDADSTNDHGKGPATTLVKKPWLNEGTPEFAKAQAYIKAGNSIADIKKKYSISKTVEAKLLA